MDKFLKVGEAAELGYRDPKGGLCNGCKFLNTGRGGTYCKKDDHDQKCWGGIWVDVPDINKTGMTGLTQYPQCKTICAHYQATKECTGCNNFEGLVPQMSAWQPLENVSDIQNEELEVDKKKDDITKAKPGQMMDDFNLALLAVSEVTRYGIEKYERPGSWKQAHKDLMKYKDAMGRHLLKQPTEMYDDESGYLHLIQVTWNCLALLQMMLEFDKVRPRDISKITKAIEGLTQAEPHWFKGDDDE